MNDTFLLTFAIIVVFTFILAFIKGRSKDKCLKCFAGNHITIEDKTGKTIWGRLRVENTGIELRYDAPKKDNDGHIESSYIMYKEDYSVIRALLRYNGDLSEKEKKKRNDELDKTYHPNFVRRSKRHFQNLFKTVRDSFMDILNLLMGQIKKKTGGASLVSSQDKYLNQMKQEISGGFSTAYEPLLEPYIGHIVIFEILKDDKICEYAGVLKEYTSDFIAFLDVSYKKEGKKSTADLVLPRATTSVRHYGE